VSQLGSADLGMRERSRLPLSVRFGENRHLAFLLGVLEDGQMGAFCEIPICL
jgi:hypothetical protein